MLSSAACDSAWAAARVVYEAVVASHGTHRTNLKLLGSKLLEAKALTPHGEWRGRLQEYGIHARRAQRAMSLAMGTGQIRQAVVFENGKTSESGGAGGASGGESDREQELRMYSNDNLDMLEFLDEDEDDEGDAVSGRDPLGVQLEFTSMYNEAARERDWGTSWMATMAERVGQGDADAMAELKRVVREMRRVPVTAESSGAAA